MRIEREDTRTQEKAQLDSLLNEAENWNKARLIRAYAKARREAEIKKIGEITPASDIAKWLE